MKGAIKTEEIDGRSFDIKKCGSEEALEAQSIFFSLAMDSGMPLDEEITYGQMDMYMMKAMTRDTVKRIKTLCMNTIVAPKMTEELFSDINPVIIPVLFFKIYEYQTGEADKKKEPRKSPTE